MVKLKKFLQLAGETYCPSPSSSGLQSEASLSAASLPVFLCTCACGCIFVNLYAWHRLLSGFCLSTLVSSNLLLSPQDTHTHTHNRSTTSCYNFIAGRKDGLLGPGVKGNNLSLTYMFRLNEKHNFPQPTSAFVVTVEYYAEYVHQFSQSPTDSRTAQIYVPSFI